MADDFKYHIDHHASLVVPAELTAARDAHEHGRLDDDALHAAEDASISDALLMQRRVGLAALSDGEFRRRNHLSAVYDGVDGFGDSAEDPGAFGRLVGPRHAPEVRPLKQEPRERGRLVKHETDFLLGGTNRPTMLALPAPGFLAELTAVDGAVDVAAAGAAFARLLRQEIAAVAADGIRYVLLTNPGYGFLLSAAGGARAAQLGLDPVSIVARMLAADAQVLDGLETHAEFRVGLDLTTGGAATGGYDTERVRGFVAGQPYDRLCVEFPAADPFPIAELRPGTVVALGVVDVGSPAVEDVDELVGRIDEAAQVMDIDDIAISTNGGFHTAAGQVAADVEHAKLQLVEMVARYFWGNEL